VLVVWETAFKGARDRIGHIMGQRFWSGWGAVRTYLLFALSLLFFRLPSVGDVSYTYLHLLDGIRMNAKELRFGMSDHLWIVWGTAVVLMMAVEWFNARTDIIAWSDRQKAVVRWPAYFLFVLLIFVYGSFGVENFIYIQF
jgi:hypothetical protein